MKKFLALLLALVMTMSLVTVGASAKTAFTDDKDITEVEAVEVLSAMGIIDGYKDGSFKPQGALNRAAGAKFIAYLMLGEKNADGLKATGTVFEDVAADYALAPYVEWCAKMGIVDGYGDGKFGPTNTLTQAAFGKMLLTALGYDSAKEGYTGAGWQKAVYADGLKAGVYGDDGEIFAACNRETAAKLALGALKADMVEYGKGDKLDSVAATAKQDQNDDDVLQLFETYKDLEYAKVAANDWGRPGHTWTYGDDFEKTYLDEPVATYTDTVEECDVLKAIGEKDDTDVDYWVNGVQDEYTLEDTDDELGGHGVLLEVYELDDDDDYDYRLVRIDTYFAQVTDVVALELDKNGHIETEASITVAGVDGTELFTLTSEKADFKYEEDDYVLVNVNETEEDSVIIGLAEKKTVEPTATKDTDNPETSYFKADGKTYNYAWTFVGEGILDEDCHDVKFNCYLDQYGYVLYVDEVDDEEITTAYVILDADVAKVGARKWVVDVKVLNEAGKESTIKVGVPADTTDFEFAGDADFAFVQLDDVVNVV